MLKKYATYSYVLFFLIVCFSCKNDDDYTNVEQSQVSPVVFNIDNVPYSTLSEYNFFKEDIASLDPVFGVLPYDLITPLFSDYAKKKRFIWMPQNKSANYVNDYAPLDFPIGTILIKNFYFENILPDASTKILETRLMILKSDGWIFANYKWNDNQTEANFDLNGSFKAFSFIENGITKNLNYRIPSSSECNTCHKSINETPIPIGPKPQNLNRPYTYDSGNENQLQKWKTMGYLSNTTPTNIESLVDWSDTNQLLEIRVRSYLDVNCAHCHSDNRHCDYRPIRFAFNESDDITNLGVCVPPNTVIDPALTFIVTPGNYERSVLHTRISSTEENLRMPLLSRTLKHTEGVVLIEQWINTLNPNCN
ncbi:hypothetical protein [Lacinutrix undariae]